MKNLTFKEIEKAMANMRKVVNGRIKYYPKNEQLKEAKSLFDQTFKSARSWLLEPTHHTYTLEEKRRKVMDLYNELQGFYDGFKDAFKHLEDMRINREANQLMLESIRRISKKEVEIKEGEVQKNPDLKEEVEIKVEEAHATSEMKKETQIKEGQIKMDLRGGARPGAGRKSLGVKKPISITLEEKEWKAIDDLIKEGEFKSYAEYFRHCSRNLNLT